MDVRISIVTITYNSEKTLEETIKSVISQNYKNLEYLIIDGGSKDNTLNIVDKYREHISYFVSEPDKGISNAFNKGVIAATGDVIGIINSDDVLLPGTLSMLANNYDTCIDVYGFNVLSWNSETQEVFRESTPPSVDFHNIYQPHNIAHPGRYIKKDAYKKFGLYDERLRYIMDHDLLVRFYKAGAVFKNIDYDGALFRIGGTTNDSIKKMKNDYKLYTLNNGGCYFSFLCYYYGYKVIRNCIKRLLSIILKPETIHKISGRELQ